MHVVTSATVGLAKVQKVGDTTVFQRLLSDMHISFGPYTALTTPVAAPSGSTTNAQTCIYNGAKLLATHKRPTSLCKPHISLFQLGALISRSFVSENRQTYGVVQVQSLLHMHSNDPLGPLLRIPAKKACPGQVRRPPIVSAHCNPFF